MSTQLRAGTVRRMVTMNLIEQVSRPHESAGLMRSHCMPLTSQQHCMLPYIPACLHNSEDRECLSIQLPQQ